MVGCPVEHVAEADDQATPGKLVIAAELTTAGKAAPSPRQISKRTVYFEAAPCPAYVGTACRQWPKLADD